MTLKKRTIKQDVNANTETVARAGQIGHNSGFVDGEAGEMDSVYQDLLESKRISNAERVQKSREKMKEQGLDYLQVAVYDEHRDDIRMIAAILRKPTHPLYERVALKVQIIRDMVG